MVGCSATHKLVLPHAARDDLISSMAHQSLKQSCSVVATVAAIAVTVAVAVAVAAVAVAVAAAIAAIATIAVAAVDWVATVAIAAIAVAAVVGAAGVAGVDDAGRCLADNLADDTSGGRSACAGGRGRRIVGTLVDDNKSWAGGRSSVLAVGASAGINVDVGGLNANGANRRNDSGFEHLADLYY